jgi:hypothetical protein
VNIGLNDVYNVFSETGTRYNFSEELANLPSHSSRKLQSAYKIIWKSTRISSASVSGKNSMLNFM